MAELRPWAATWRAWLPQKHGRVGEQRLEKQIVHPSAGLLHGGVRQRRAVMGFGDQEGSSGGKRLAGPAGGLCAKPLLDPKCMFCGLNRRRIPNLTASRGTVVARGILNGPSCALLSTRRPLISLTSIMDDSSEVKPRRGYLFLFLISDPKKKKDAFAEVDSDHDSCICGFR